MKYFLAALALATSNLALAEGSAADPMGVTGQLIFLGGFLVIFYFLLWRPQSKRQKEHKNLISGLAKGDEVVTARSEEHTSELQSRPHLVCRLLLEKKKTYIAFIGAAVGSNIVWPIALYSYFSFNPARLSND